MEEFGLGERICERRSSERGEIFEEHRRKRRNLKWSFVYKCFILILSLICI
jgi:hypothetical protein